ncbi:MAG: nickel pincer cofactor biosynthesis protein LarC [Candidatus Eisenbacteria bacterium]|nr:nickel pincer cofactor biosynthesis protein LarC [Candidatus Eisenbacteria bacterium]
MQAYLDLTVGLAGDMMVGALLDAGWPEEAMRGAIEAIGAPEIRVTVERRTHQGIVGLGIRVEAAEEPPARSLVEIRRLLEGSRLPATVKARSLSLFERLGEAEARVHGTVPDRVHFHELGAIDSIADIVLAVAGLEALGIDRLASGPVPVSRGEMQTDHGLLPLPAPATLHLLEGLPLRWLPFEGEWLTPTGALILGGLVHSFGPPPSIVLERVGIGAGTRKLEGRPNIVRLLLGRSVKGDSSASKGENREAEIEAGFVSILEANVDDQEPRQIAEAVRRLEEAGALEVFRTAVAMKKGRQGVLLTVLCRPEDEENLAACLLRETTSLGLRMRREERRELLRRIEPVATPFGDIRIKWSRPGGIPRPMVEFEDVRAAAERHQVPFWVVERAALEAAPRDA